VNESAGDEWDVIVVGSGAGALSAAVTARGLGLKVVVLEKAPLFGGTSARSGGVLWIPGNGKFPQGEQPAGQDAVAYMRHEVGEAFDARRVAAFLEAGPRMIRYMEQETTAVRFIPAHGFADYHTNAPGAVATGRSIAPAPFDGKQLGREIRRLRPPLAEITLMGMMLNASDDVKHFFNATKSLKSLVHVTKLIAKYLLDLARYGRAMRLTNGNALIARLGKSYFDLGGELRTDCAVERLLTGLDGRVTGVEATWRGKRIKVQARLAVILGAGGFPRDPARVKQLFPHEIKGGEHLSPAAESSTGDGIAMAETVGGQFSSELSQPAAWIPVSRVPDPKQERIFPHLIDRYKPGVIMVNRAGRRFVNESDSYHDVGQAMIKDPDRGISEEAFAWLIADHRSIRKYGLGHVKPAPFMLLPYLRSGYLRRGRTPEELAAVIGVNPTELAQTLEEYNRHASDGKDPQYGRGETAYNRYLGDPQNKPNACVAPLASRPLYAIRVVLGDLGTFAGIVTDERGRVMRRDRSPVPGLYAVGNDALSLMGGNYPGGGITLGPGMTFGFLAAEDIAASAKA